MTESEFNQQIDATLLQIEEALDECEIDIDYENSSGILTLTFDNGSQIIINRQLPTRQLWLAARSGGYHFDFEAELQQWLCDSGAEPLRLLLNRCASEQAGEAVELSW
ncbi:iron donor protein CyaY [Ectothiorhodospiraceae bacterium BW-2]|nr:iron donor protein CyaY [Ectothiorhodospiraceae bacterium BW-2]